MLKSGKYLLWMEFCQQFSNCIYICFNPASDIATWPSVWLITTGEADLQENVKIL